MVPVFISELLDYLGQLAIKNGYMLGWGAPVPWGKRQWVGINFCQPEVKLQQQCHMQNTILIYPRPAGSHFSGRERECQYILETATGELEGKMKMTIQ